MVTVKLGTKKFNPDVTVPGLDEVGFASKTIVTTLRAGFNLGKFEVDIGQDGIYIKVETSNGPMKFIQMMGIGAYKPFAAYYKCASHVKAEEGSSDGKFFYGMRTNEWVDLAKEPLTTGASNSEGDSAVCAGVSGVSSDFGGKESTFDEEDNFTSPNQVGYSNNNICLDHVSMTTLNMEQMIFQVNQVKTFIDRQVCLLYTSPSPRDLSTSRMPSSA